MAGTTSQTKTVLKQQTILPSILRIIRNFEMPDITRSSLFDSIRTDVYWIIGEIACHTDQINLLLDSKIMPAVINRFGREYNSYEQVAAAKAIDKFISNGSFSQIVEILNGDDCIRYLFEILDDIETDEWYETEEPVIRSILYVINILKNLLKKHEKNQQLIKSTIMVGDQKEFTANDQGRETSQLLILGLTCDLFNFYFSDLT